MAYTWEVMALCAPPRRTASPSSPTFRTSLVWPSRALTAGWTERFSQRSTSRARTARRCALRSSTCPFRGCTPPTASRGLRTASASAGRRGTLNPEPTSDGQTRAARWRCTSAMASEGQTIRGLGGCLACVLSDGGVFPCATSSAFESCAECRDLHTQAEVGGLRPPGVGCALRTRAFAGGAGTFGGCYLRGVCRERVRVVQAQRVNSLSPPQHLYYRVGCLSLPHSTGR